MSSSFNQIGRYLSYRIKAVNAHGLHSPFLFDFYNKTIKASSQPWIPDLELIRYYVLSNKKQLAYKDPRTGNWKREKIASWAKRVTSRKKFMLFLIKLINWLGASTVLETGTASGINTCSLALSNAEKIVTIEGSPEIAQFARSNISFFGKGKVELVEGKVQDLFLKTALEHQPDLIFLDADHRSETIHHYLEAIKQLNQAPKAIIIHDIHWSKDMEQVWKSIIQNEQYPLTVDLFQAGIIFPNHSGQKQHFAIRFR